MSGCVVEFEAFRDNNKQFVIKELAIADIEHGLSRVVLFAPPYERTRLNTKLERTADWVERHLHGISWHDGNVDYNRLSTIIRHFTETYSSVYTKGREKARFLSGFHPNVTDLDDLNAPKYDYESREHTFQCPVSNHNCTDSDKTYLYSCALRKAEYFANWMRKEKSENVYGLQSFTPLAKRGLYYDGAGIKCASCGTCVFLQCTDFKLS